MVAFAALILETSTENAFLLTRQWRDAPSGIEIVFWARGELGPIRIRLDGQEAVAFAERDLVRADSLGCRTRAVALRTFDSVPVDALYFKSTDAAAYYDAYGDISRNLATWVNTAIYEAQQRR